MELTRPNLICLSHLRWAFVYQRPQHLLSRFARKYRVLFFEEPVFAGGEPRLEVRRDPESGVIIAVPHMAAGLQPEEVERIQAGLINDFIDIARVQDYLLWYYTPMALGFTKQLTPSLVIYDCMDELSGFKGAPAALADYERELFDRANLVFTGGRSLYQAKKDHHPDIHAFPSSVDIKHFGQARQAQPDPQDQAQIPHPRMGYCGVIDERMDLELLKQTAERRPDWHFVMIGPVVKIDPVTLPKLHNIHYLGGKSYKELPQYLAGWDAAMLPFARNQSTRFISPTKTPEYLAAGLPTVSTSIQDVARPYGEFNLVGIADEPEAFVTALDSALNTDRTEWLPHVDDFLKSNSWDATWTRMMALIEPRLAKPQNQEIAASR